MTIIGSEADPENTELQGVPLIPEGHGPNAPLQQELPFAIVAGEAMTEVPKDLYIPPDALEIFLEAFEGPLDLLLYLIRRQNIDILEINVADITDQYMNYVDLMESWQFELAAEYLVMAAMLAEIKSRILLPRQVEEEAEEDDPRMQLIRRLQEYERFKQAAQDVDELPRMDRDIHRATAALPEIERVTAEPTIDLKEVLIALSSVLKRADNFGHHHVQLETLSTREKMSEILVRISNQKFVPLVSLADSRGGPVGSGCDLPGHNGANERFVDRDSPVGSVRAYSFEI